MKEENRPCKSQEGLMQCRMNLPIMFGDFQGIWDELLFEGLIFFFLPSGLSLQKFITNKI